MRKKTLFLCAAVLACIVCVFFYRWTVTPQPERLVIVEKGNNISVGQQMQLEVECYLADGSLATSEQLTASGLQWRTSRNPHLAVDEHGMVTGLSPGSGNVQAYIQDLYSRPLTIHILQVE